MYSSGRASPSLIASIIACIEASGVRRSWLAHATSSRRASKRRSIESAIALNDVGHLRDLGRSLLGRSRGEVAGGEPGRGEPQAVERRADPVGEQERRDDGGEGGGRGHGEDLGVGVHLEHHPARGEHAGERQDHREQRERRQLQPQRGKQPQQQGGEHADRERPEREQDRELDHGVSR